MIGQKVEQKIIICHIHTIHILSFLFDALLGRRRILQKGKSSSVASLKRKITG